MEEATLALSEQLLLSTKKELLKKLLQKSPPVHTPNKFSICTINKTNNMSKERKEINKEKLKALEVTLGKIEKDFGKGTIMKLGDHAIDNIQVISTGSIVLMLLLE